MTTFWSDNCLGTDGNNAITSSPSSGSVGATYAARPGNESLLLIKTNRYYADGSSDGYVVLQPSGQPTTADVRTTFTIRHVAADTSKVRLYARYSAASGGNGYYCLVEDNAMTIIKMVNGTETTLVFGFFTPLADGAQGDFAFDVTGTTLNALFNGVSVCSITDATHSATGTCLNVFLGHASATSGNHLVAALGVDSSAGSTPTKLAVTTQPSGAATGVALATQPVIAVQDVSSATVTSDTSIVVATLNTVSGTGSLGGTTSKAAVAGVATFTNLAVTSTSGGVFTITFTDGSLTSVTSAPFTIIGTASKLGITTQPAGAVSGTALTTQPVVVVQDSQGTTVTGSTASILATLVSSGGQALTGTATKSAVAGVATYTNLVIAGAVACTITFSSSGLTSITSASISVGIVSNTAVITCT